ncbi:MAG: class I SAM-dependent methyltransferase [Pseudohongiellaceae bacterium]
MSTLFALERSPDPALEAAQLDLHRKLACPLVAAAESGAFDFVLRHEAAGLTLYATATNAPGGVRVDFCDPALRRRAADGLRRQDLVKAVGVKGTVRPSVLDATAGLGSDGFLLAAAGCSVQLLERSAVVHALLADGLQRGAAPGSPVADIVARLSLIRDDFIDAKLPVDAVDVVYLDPMFPADRKSARSGKGMYLLQELLGPASDEGRLFTRAIGLASRRVVVKRGKLSPAIADQVADICFRGSSSRYDVYLQR